MTVHGQTAHASHYPEVGENALISGGRLAAAIEALPTLQHPHLKHGTWCVRYMEGGNPGTLVVPEKCYLFVDRYVVPGETDEICIAQIMEAAEQLGLSGKVDVRLKPRKSPYMQSFAVEEDHPLVKILQEEFHSVTGKDLPCAYDTSVCDSNILADSLGLSGRDVRPLGRQHARRQRVRLCMADEKLRRGLPPHRRAPFKRRSIKRKKRQPRLSLFLLHFTQILHFFAGF